MKRLYIGICLLAAILGAGLSVSAALRQIHGPMEAALLEASRAALEENWEKASALTGEVRAEWNQRKPFLAAVTDQGPMEETDFYLAQLEILASRRKTAEFAALCRGLAEIMASASEAQAVSWPNFL